MTLTIDNQKLTYELKDVELFQLVELIRKDWKNPYFGAKPWLDAMAQLDSIKDNFYMESGKTVVMYFLANANTWRGEVARAVKKELQHRIK